MEETPDIKKIVIGAALGVIVIAVVVYGGYSFSRKNSLNPTPTTSPVDENQPTTTINLFTVDPAVPWITYQQPEYSYSFSYPQTLPLFKFTDPAFSVGIKWNDVDPKYNILSDQESIKVKDAKSSGNMEQFVNNWWQSFSGLTGVKTVTRFTNTNGLTGYRAIYVNKAGETPNVDIFFANPDNPDSVVHFANGMLDSTVFDRIIDSIKFVKTTAKQSPQSNGQEVTQPTPAEIP